MNSPRLPLAFVVMACLLLAVGLFGLHAVNAVNARFDPLVDETVPRLLTLQEIQGSAARLSVDLVRHIYSAHLHQFGVEGKRARPAHSEDRTCEEALARFEAALDDYEVYHPSGPASVIIQESGRSIMRQAVIIGEMADGGSSIAELAPYLADLQDTEDQFHAALDETIAREIAHLEAEDARADRGTTTQRAGSIGVTGVALLLVSGVGFVMSRRVDAARRGDEQRFRSVVEQSFDGFCLVDSGGAVVEWNQGAERLTGLPRSQVRGQRIWDVQHRMLPAEMRTPHARGWLKHMFGELLEMESVPWAGRLVEHKIVHPDGSQRVIQTVTSPIQARPNIYISSIIRDVTEQKAAQAEILQRNAEMRALLTVGQRLTAQIDLEERLTTVTRAIVDALPAAEAASLWLFDPNGHELHVCTAAGYADGINAGAVLPLAGWIYRHGEARIVKDASQEPLLNDTGQPGWALRSMIGVPITINNAPAGVLFADSFSQEAAFDADALRLLQVLAGQAAAAIQNSQLVTTLTDQHDELQRLSAQLASIREAECRRISRELHDEVGQALTAASINLSTLMANGAAAHPGGRRRLDETASLIEQVLGQVREMSMNLHPAMLDDLGLAPTLRWYLKKWEKRVGVRVDQNVQEIRLPQELETVLYRLVQEALTNVARHAQAGQVSISLGQEGDELVLSVADDGRGFRLRPGEIGEGLGLIGMRERVATFNGQFTIQSQPGQGTCLTVRVPLVAG
jgi:PAS domain S-box-containing protein